MSCIVYQTDHKTGVKYAYESVSYWDKEKKQPRSKRKYIGRVDPETGEIIKKKEPGAHSGDAGERLTKELSELRDRLKEKDQTIAYLKAEIKQKEGENKKLQRTIKSISKLISEELNEA